MKKSPINTTTGSSTGLVLLVGLVFAINKSSADNKMCDANPECAKLQLADDCCPTSLAGIFLDCCEQPDASCDANVGCRGLADDCCPAADGTFLFCCFAPDPDEVGYNPDYVYFADQDGGDEVGEFLASTGQRVNSDDDNKFEYSRDESSLYDLIYLKGDVPDAGAYVNDDKKFFVNIETTAPACTQVILQFDQLPEAKNDNYPVGRHSRYLGTISPDQNWIEFDFLDRPDESVPDSAVNAVALMFDPGHFSSDLYTFWNLGSYNKCSSGEGCDPPPTKSCPALYVEIGTVSDLQQQQPQAESQTNTTATSGSGSEIIPEGEEDCNDCANPACINVGDCTIVTSYEALWEDPSLNAASDSPTSKAILVTAIASLGSAFVLLVS